MTPYDLIKAACVRSNPAIETTEMAGCPDGQIGCTVFHCKKVSREIRLADVLHMLKANYSSGEIGRSTLARLVHDSFPTCWNLRVDNLSKQSEETLTFLASLLT